MRKDFTKSERAAIAEALEREMENRQGQRTDLQENQLQETCTEVQTGQQTRDIVARKAGFVCGPSYQQAKEVIDHGTQELKDAMDNGAISIRNASVLAKLPA